ncbi:AAA family ATPase, partial [Patescibacteria group bacterium]|nr:AAA family ATPase [Patescibacteria group bacterium]
MTQKEALDILKMGHSVYLTGEAGAGKTHVLNQYIAWLREHDIEPAVTASTGIAATHLGGGTIHSWSGIGIRERISEADLDKMEQKRPLYKRLNETRVLIIDEISMLSGEFFDMCDQVLQYIRRNE